MIVCLCKGVSSKTILNEVRRGCRTVQGVARACEAGTGCGACVRQIRQMVEAAGSPARERDPGTDHRG